MLVVFLRFWEVWGIWNLVSASTRLEVRGLGILSFPLLDAAVIRLVVDLVKPEDVTRLPDQRMTELFGIDVPAVTLDPFEASAVTKVHLALELTLGRIMRHDD